LFSQREKALWYYGTIALMGLLVLLFSSRCIVRFVAGLFPGLRRPSLRPLTRRERNSQRFLD